MPSSADTNPRIVKNSLFGVSGQAAGGLLAFAAFVLTARQLGVERFGILSFLVAFTSVFQLGASLGLVNVLIREVSHQRDQAASIMGRAIPLVVVLSLVVLASMFGAIAWLDLDPAARDAAHLLGLATILTINAVVLGVVPRAFEDMGYNAFATASQRLVLLVLVVVGLAADAGLRGFALAYLASGAYHLLFFVFLLARRYDPPVLSVDVRYAAHLLREALPLGFGLLFRRVTLHVDTLLLGWLSSASSVGLFNAAYRAVNVIEVLPMTLALPLLPALARAARAGSSERFFELCHAAHRFFFLLALPLVVWLLLVGPSLLLALYGPRFEASTATLLVLCASVLFLFPNALYAHVFAALGRQRTFLFLAGAALAINAALDLLVIPLWDHLGAAFATLVAEAALFVGGARALHGLGYRGEYARLLVKPGLAAGGAAALLLRLPESPSWWLLLISSLGYAALYLVLLIVLRAVTSSDWTALRQSLARGERAARESGRL